MKIEVILIGFLLSSACGEGVTDVVLSCSLVEEGAGLGGMGGGGSLFSRTPATIVLRDVVVAPDESLETLTPFVPPSIPDPDAILLEAKVSSPQIPNVDVLLHADCNEQEVVCEVSRYSLRGSRDSGSDPAHFMVSLSVDGVDFSTALILQTLTVEKDESTLTQTNLGLPLSRSGTILTEVVFLVFSHMKSVSAALKEDVLLHCGFKQPETLTAQEVDIEWRLQHRGKGEKVIEMKTRLDDAGGSAVVNTDRTGSSIDPQLVVEGNASATLTKLKVSDEGTYICTVTVGSFRAQQVVRLHILQPPRVSLSEEKLVLKPPQTLSCHCSNYYPLDVQMEWSSLSPGDSEPTVFPDQGSLSSHRQHFDGTYSLSSHLTIPPTVLPGTELTCTVTHPTLDAPVSVSVTVESPEPDSYWWVPGFLIITVIFFYQVMR